MIIKEHNNEIITKIKNVLAEYTDVETNDIQMKSKLTSDLGLTSFDLFCLMSSLEEEFNMTIDDTMMKSMQTVEDVYNVLA